MDTVAKLKKEEAMADISAGQLGQTQRQSIVNKDVVSFANLLPSIYDIQEPSDAELALLEPLDLTVEALLSNQLSEHQQFELDKLHGQIAQWVFNDRRSQVIEQRIENAFNQIDALLNDAYNGLCATEKAKVDALQAQIDSLYQGTSNSVNPKLGYYPV